VRQENHHHGMTYAKFCSLKDDDVLKPGEVAALFRVDPKTVARWNRTGKLDAIRLPGTNAGTLGAHRRYRVADVRPLLVREVLK
jgi:DNA-binding transcriptional MerR regulator